MTGETADSSAFGRFRAARDVLLAARGDHERARAEFRWPQLEHFNWAVDWFDQIARDNDATALRIVSPAGESTATYAQLSNASSRVQEWLDSIGVRRGDRVLLVLDTCVETWEILLALMKLRAVAVPVFTTLSSAEILDRARRSRADHVITSTRHVDRLDGLGPLIPGHRILIDGERSGWFRYRDAASARPVRTAEATPADEVMSYYFTSGSTAPPKLVAHTHVSYPVGHLTGMYWAGLQPGDVHLNVSSPGWAKHPWSSFFAPWNAEATIVAVDTRDARPDVLLRALESTQASSFCAPPTIWRSLLSHGLGGRRLRLREAMSVGEPLTQDIVDAVRSAWGVTVRNGYGQSEVTAMTGVLAGSADDPRSLGRELPGYTLALQPWSGGPDTGLGEIVVDLGESSPGLMHGYLDDEGRRLGPDPRSQPYYRTGDLARRLPSGALQFVGRVKDVFRTEKGVVVAPAAIEEVLLSHAATAEAAVVSCREEGPGGPRWIAKAFVVAAPGWHVGPATAEALFQRIGGSEQIHETGDVPVVIEFVDSLPRTESGKIYREALRDLLRSPLVEFTASRVPAAAAEPIRL